jgi:hypothetical protein
MSGYFIGLFAIKPAQAEQVRAAFRKANAALENFDEGWEALEDAAYKQARAAALDYAELNRAAENAALTSLIGLMKNAAPGALSEEKFYTPAQAKRYLRAMNEVERSSDGEGGMVERIWSEDRALDKADVARFYRAYKRMLESAVEKGGAFATAFLG